MSSPENSRPAPEILTEREELVMGVKRSLYRLIRQGKPGELTDPNELEEDYTNFHTNVARLNSEEQAEVFREANQRKLLEE